MMIFEFAGAETGISDRIEQNSHQGSPLLLRATMYPGELVAKVSCRTTCVMLESSLVRPYGRFLKLRLPISIRIHTTLMIGNR
jgi:hypothetical protein